MTTFGKDIRLGRLFHTASGKLITLAIDHGASYRFDLPLPLLELPQTVARFHGEFPDAIVAQRGLFGATLRPFAGRVPLMLQAIAATPDRLEEPYLISTVGDAVALGADAIALAFAVGGEMQKVGLGLLGKLVRQARPVGMPVVAHIYPTGKEFRDNPFSPRGVAYAARAGFEAGADMVKVHYTGDAESFRKIVDCIPIPVFVAGGPQLESPLKVLQMAREALGCGAAGVTIGRNLWGDANPPALLRALKRVAHQGVSPEEAHRAYFSETK